ncbi:MAG: YncE family protein [Acidobacteriota bacterium]|nr:YncE family protein [Acidobacteriota bacterium]
MLLLPFLLPWTGPVAAQTPAGRPVLLAISKGDHTLAMVDAATLTVLARMPVGEDPHEVVASADGRTAYVSNYGGGSYHSLAVLDLVHRQALPSIDLGLLRGPHGLDFADGKLWFTAEGAKAIGRLDPASGQVDWLLGTGQDRTHMIYVAPDRSWIATTNVASATVSLIEPAPPQRRMSPPSGVAPPRLGGPRPPPRRMGPPPPPNPQGDWTETVIPVGRGSEGFDVSPDGREIWTANAEDGTVSILNRASHRVVATLQANVRSANRLKFTLDGQRVLISSLGAPDLVVLDAASHRELKRIPIGTGAAGIQMDPDGTRAFVACSPDDSIAVVDLRTLTVTSRIHVGPEPDGLAWAVVPQ